MSVTIDTIEPQAVWQEFSQLAARPRPSGEEAKVMAYIKSVAEQEGLEYFEDAKGNILVNKAGQGAGAGLQGYLLQAHTDMVCEKNQGTEHDFSVDPIRLELKNSSDKGQCLHAIGTSLGSDNGIGASYMLALMKDKELEHAPLQFLFTVEEETGLKGAQNLALQDKIVQRRMVNMDAEDERSFCIGCAGSYDCVNHIPITREAAPSGLSAFRISITGLMGGHSGLNIGAQRGNAIQEIARIALDLGDDIHLASIEGGGRRNALPRECFAEVYAEQERLASHLSTWQKRLNAEYHPDFDSIALDMQPLDAPPSKVMSQASKNMLLNLVLVHPHGVQELGRRSGAPGIPSEFGSIREAVSMVISISGALTIIHTEEDEVQLTGSVRFDDPSKSEQYIQVLKSIALFSGGRHEVANSYPAWPVWHDSPLEKQYRKLYSKVYAKEPLGFSIHAGLECGIITSYFEDMEAIAIGPNIHSPHTPHEHVEVESVAKVWQIARQLLCS